MHRRTRLRKSLTVRSTSFTGPPFLTLEPVLGILNTISTPFDYGRGGPGGWWIVYEPQIHLGEDIVVPDTAGWRRERMPVYPDTAYTTLAPDWVCEVLSPSTRKLDLGGKSAVYARAGVGYLWFVDPIARSLEANVLRGGKWVEIATLYDDATVSLPPFEAISFNLGRFVATANDT